MSGIRRWGAGRPWGGVGIWALLAGLGIVGAVPGQEVFNPRREPPWTQVAGQVAVLDGQGLHFVAATHVRRLGLELAILATDLLTHPQPLADGEAEQIGVALPPRVVFREPGRGTWQDWGR